MATINDFNLIDMRVGRIMEVHDFPEANKPAYRLLVDFGENIGLKHSSAQITDLYTKEELVGRLVVAVVNFPPRQIAHYTSEVLVMGVPNEKGQVVLLQPEKHTPVGVRVY